MRLVLGKQYAAEWRVVALPVSVVSLTQYVSKIYVCIVVELPMYDFVTVILGTLLVQLFLILFGVHFYFALYR